MRSVIGWWLYCVRKLHNLKGRRLRMWVSIVHEMLSHTSHPARCSVCVSVCMSVSVWWGGGEERDCRDVRCTVHHYLCQFLYIHNVKQIALKNKCLFSRKKPPNLLKMTYKETFSHYTFPLAGEASSKILLFSFWLVQSFVMSSRWLSKSTSSVWSPESSIWLAIARVSSHCLSIILWRKWGERGFQMYESACTTHCALLEMRKDQDHCHFVLSSDK